MSTPLDLWMEQWAAKPEHIRANLNTAHRFLTTHFGADDALSRIRCIDFSHPVRLPRIPRGTEFVSFVDPRIPPQRSTSFTLPGYSTWSLGISNVSRPPQGSMALKRFARRFVVAVEIPEGDVLESVCAPARDHWSIENQIVLAAGGGIQFLIPWATRYLRAM